MPNQIIASPYKEFTFTIPAGAVEPVYYVHNFFRVLSVSAAGLQYKWNASGDFTPVQTGVGFQLQDAADFVQIFNTTGGAITVTVALCVGIIFDDRTALSGAVLVRSGTTITTPAQTSVGTTAVLVAAADTSRNSIILQNTSTASQRITIGDINVVSLTRGIILEPGSSVSGATLGLDVSAAIYAVSTAAGGTLNTLSVTA